MSDCQQPNYSSARGAWRLCLVALLIRLSATRRRLDDFVGLDFLRGLGAVATDNNSSRSFSKQSATFFGWSR